MALGMLKIKNCQIAAWTAWLEAYMSSDETPTFVNAPINVKPQGGGGVGHRWGI